MLHILDIRVTPNQVKAAEKEECVSTEGLFDSDSEEEEEFKQDCKKRKIISQVSFYNYVTTILYTTFDPYNHAAAQVDESVAVMLNIASFDFGTINY